MFGAESTGCVESTVTLSGEGEFVGKNWWSL